MFLLQRRLLMSTSVAALSAATVAVSDAETLAGSETDALAIVYTDDHFKATTGFNGSVFCVDSGTPANDYDSSPTTETASYFTYTSPSPKMILHDDGVLKYAAHNLITNAEDLSAGSYTTFDVSVTANSTTDPNGDSTADLITITGTTAPYLRSGPTVIAGYSIRHSFCFKAGTHDYIQLLFGGGFSTGYVNFDISAGTKGTESGASGTIEDLGSGWYRCSIVPDSVSGTDPQPHVWAVASTTAGRATAPAGTGGTFYMWGGHVHYHPADTTYLKTTSAARYADPIEFNSAGTALGALVEPQRTNLALYNSQFDNAAWLEFNIGTVSAGSVTAPNGLDVAETLTASSGSAVHIIYANKSTTASTNYALSFFVKKGTHRYVAINFQSATEEFACAVFDLDGGGTSATETDVGTTSGTIASTKMEAVGNGWYRLVLVAQTGGTGGFIWVGFAEAATGNTFSSTGQISFNAAGTETFHVWGAQLEEGSAATSMIETYGSTVTRAADQISLATSVFPYGASANTFYLDVSSEEYIATGGRLFEASPTARADVVQLRDNGSNTLWQNFSGGGFSVDAQYSFTTPTRGTRYKTAFACEDNNINGSYEGAAGTNDTSCDYQNTAHTKISLGGNVSGGEIAHCYIAAVLILPRRVSDADMQTLTSTGALP